MKISNKEIRLRADLHQIVSELDLEYRHRGKDIVFQCQSGEHPDRSPSAVMRDEIGEEKHGLIYCFSCQWSTDIFGLIQQVKKCKFGDAVYYVQSRSQRVIGGGDENQNIYLRHFRSYYPQRMGLPDGVEKIEEDSRCWRYLEKRKFGKEEIQFFDLRDWVSEKRVFIPIYRQKRMISYVARSYASRDPKVMTPLTADGTRWGIFNIDNVDFENPVHVTEGWASAIRVWQAGFRNVIAMGGSRIKIQQMEDLRKISAMVMWLEGDRAGRNFLFEVLGWLGSHCRVEYIGLPDGCDPADFDVEELKTFSHRRKDLEYDKKNFVDFSRISGI